jgi:hypothetical protein
VDFANTGVLQSSSRQRIQVSLPAAAIIAFETNPGTRISGEKGLFYLLTDFKSSLRYRWPEPDQQVGRVYIQPGDCILDDARGEPSPTRMSSRKNPAID